MSQPIPLEGLQQRRPKRRYLNIGSTHHSMPENNPPNPHAPGLPGGLDQWNSPQWVITDDTELLGMPGADLAADRSWKSPIWQSRPWSEDNINRDKQGKFHPQWQSPRWKSSWDSPQWDDTPTQDAAAKWKEEEHKRDEEGKFSTMAAPTLPKPEANNITQAEMHEAATYEHWSPEAKAKQLKWDIMHAKTKADKAYGQSLLDALEAKPEQPAKVSHFPVHFSKSSDIPEGTTLNDVKFTKWTPPDTTAAWNKVEGQMHLEGIPVLKPPPGKHPAAGVLIEEPDGRVWIVKPTNEFGGYKYTFPKGTQETGMNLQATAIKEAYEESGLQVQITGFAGDFEGDTSVTRYYKAKRIGGTPTDHGWESERVSLIPKDKLNDYLNKERDQDIAKAHLIPSEKPPEKPAEKPTEPDKPWEQDAKSMGVPAEHITALKNAGYHETLASPSGNVYFENAAGDTVQFITNEQHEMDSWNYIPKGAVAPSDKGYGITSLKSAIAPTDEPPPAEATKPKPSPKFNDLLTAQGFTLSPDEPGAAGSLWFDHPDGWGVRINPAYEDGDPEADASWVIKKPNGDLVSEVGLSKLQKELADLGLTKQPAAPAKPTAAKPAPIGEKLDLKGMSKTGPQKGSNPGGQYTAPDGSKRYAKFYQTDDHARNEMLAAALFSRLGGNTLNYHPIVDSEGQHGSKGKLGVSTDWATNLGATKIDDFTPEQRKAAQDDFALHVWLANWDATGSDPEGGYNLNIVDGKQTPMDFGGSLLYRAMGGPKGNAFNNNADEWDTLRDPDKNPNGAKLYGAMTNAQLKQSVNRLKAIDFEDVDSLVEQFGPGDDNAKIKLIDTLMARRKNIIGKASKLSGEEAKPAEATKSEQPAWLEGKGEELTPVSQMPGGLFGGEPTEPKITQPFKLDKLVDEAGGKEWHSPDGKKHNIYFKGAAYKDIYYDVNDGKFKGTKYSKHSQATIDDLGKQLFEAAGISTDEALDQWDSPRWSDSADWHSPQWNDNLIEHQHDQMVTAPSAGPPAFIKRRAQDMIKQLTAGKPQDAPA